MTLKEFSDGLDTLLNSYNIQAGFGEGASKQQGSGITLDEYEKSVLLTQAQDIIVKSYFDRTLNQQGQGFDDTARRQVDFSSLIKVKHYNHSDSILIHDDNKCYDDRGLLVTLEKNILFVLNERFEVGTSANKKVYIVVPLNYREYDREMSKAYAQPLKKQAWRLFSNSATGYDIQSEIIPIYGTTETKTETVSYVQITRSGDDPDIIYEWEDTSEVVSPYILKGTVNSKDNLPEPSKALYDENAAYKIVTETTTSDAMSYVIRYVERPTPIVLRTLPDGLSIDGESNEKECSLNPILHIDILNKAFELAVTTRGGGGQRNSPQELQRDNSNRQ